MDLQRIYQCALDSVVKTEGEVFLNLVQILEEVMDAMELEHPIQDYLQDHVSEEELIEFFKAKWIEVFEA